MLGPTAILRLTRARVGHLPGMDVREDEHDESRFERDPPHHEQAEEHERALTQRELVRASLLRLPPRESAEARRR